MSGSNSNRDIFDANGYNCWLGYHLLPEGELRKAYIKWASNIVISHKSDDLVIAANELKSGIKGILGIDTIETCEPGQCSFIVMGALGRGQDIDSYVKYDEIEQIGREGFIIKSMKTDDCDSIVVAGITHKGLLYGVFSLLRLMQTQTPLSGICKIENPLNQLRIINHWDNIDGSVERGYSGKSIFFKDNKITYDPVRIRDYARLLCSVGINSIVINNVNVHQYETMLITDRYLKDVAKLAEVFRNYGIRLYLSANFASTIEIGRLTTADPLNSEVKQWWKDKAAEIYSYIPDFGGFLIKADSEFRPGPFTYGRSHADGANMLAEALEPYGGLVIWRCFVYNCMQDWRDRTTDRAKAAYDNFMPLDGQFKENVLLQIKNGPMDFQVREPVSPLFGGLRKTNQLLELQITQEYTGQQKHLCYLVPMWKEILDFDTMAKGKDTSVREIVSGSVFNNKCGGFAAVSNMGDDSNWTGHQMAQSNMYGYARLSWNPQLTSEQITDEWVRMTYSNDAKVVDTVKQMLLGSWRTYENYTSPLGIGWMVNPNHHYGPNVDGYEYDKWGTYHRADHEGFGVDRTVKSGTGYAGQYHKEVAGIYEDMEKCPEELLLFFHHVPYDYRLKTGETLIQYIYNTHFEGVEQVEELRRKWLGLKGLIGEEIFGHVLDRLDVQLEHSKEWRDVINTYFYRKTGIPDAKGRKIY
ncbi:MAG TPA: alpha-glucuronidase family glycosyl hydrolase [Ruminiclostridium sp.]|nr:alpha-glucuronidase family glycosyl hydrolase [Ruminiclostridium sp.]